MVSYYDIQNAEFMVVTYITSEKIMLQSIYYKSFSYQHLSEQATLLISIHNVKNGFYWLN